jgi:cytochrome d ubiquinol oxidase subunit I
MWLVSIGTMLSALWILSANSFMQRPVGYEIHNGRAEMKDFFALLTNEQLLWEFPHTLFAAIATGAFLVAGISAWKLMHKMNLDFFKPSFKVSIIVALISSMLIPMFGHGQAQYLVETQPMKMAASEGLWENSSDPAAWTVIARIDPEKKENSFEFKLPYLLSLLSYNKLSGAVLGMNELQAQYEKAYGPGNYIPPVRTTFWSFRIMIAAGCAMIVLALYGAYLTFRKKLEGSHRWFFRLMMLGISLPFIGNTAGWIMTEVGRQPWTVFGLLQTKDSVSPTVVAGEVLFSLISFTALYLILTGVLAFLFVRTARKGPDIESHQETVIHDPFAQGGDTIVFK